MKIEMTKPEVVYKNDYPYLRVNTNRGILDITINGCIYSGTASEIPIGRDYIIIEEQK